MPWPKRFSAKLAQPHTPRDYYRDFRVVAFRIPAAEVADLKEKLRAYGPEKAAEEQGVYFGGRLGEYKYYDMDKVIASALDLCGKLL